MQTSLRLFGVDAGRAVSDIVMSSNVTLGVAKPGDPGLARERHPDAGGSTEAMAELNAARDAALKEIAS